jgi:hypothetical protein
MSPMLIRRHTAFILLMIFIFAWIEESSAQARGDLNALLTQIRAGERAEVAKLLPALEKSHPDKAGVLFLEAACEENAEKAIDLYQRIVDEHARSSWADDALFRLYQYSYAVGAYRTARSYTARLERDYPKSPYVPENKRASSESSSEKKQFSVQVGAYSKEKDAAKQVAELKAKGYTAYIQAKTVNGKSVHAVWLGIFPDYSQAQIFARKLKEQQGVEALVVRR